MSRVENLCHDYGDFKIEIPLWEIPDQGVTALWGPSGSGKTSVFRLLLGLDLCPNLIWMSQGVNLAALSPPERRIGVVFQTLELFPHMSAAENILFAARARARALPIATAQQKLEELAEDLRMTSFLSRRAGVLSGGEAQRVALARAVIGQPRFLFLDEPFASLDSELRFEARAMVKRLVQKLKVPTLLVTHDAEDLQDLADVVTKIRDGRLS